MPLKSKQRSQDVPTLSSHAGFLQPTKASQRRSVHHRPEVSSKRNPRNIRKRGSRLRSAEYDKRISGTELKSAVELYKSSSTSESSWSESRQINEANDLADARKMCEALQKQIDELKVNQENITLSMGHPVPSNTDNKKQLGLDQTLKATDLQNGQSGALHQNSFIKVAVTKNPPRALNDASNFIVREELPNIQAYNSTFRKQDAPSFMIKKLHTERDKYKHKVLKLQTELKLAKRTKQKVLTSPEISSGDLTFYNSNMIGEGQLAVVYTGTLNGKAVAVKKLSKLGMMSSSDRSYLTAEAGLLMHLQHRNIVKIHGVCSSPMEPLIVTEFVNGKSLQYILLNEYERMRPTQYYMLARDMAIGLAYLHNQKPPVLHLNLRPSNVLVDTLGRCKVADFGFSKIRLGADLSSPSSLAYLAPELLKYPVHLTGKIDVFAYALLLWQCHTRKDPAENRTTSEILDMLQNNVRLLMPVNLPSSIQNLIGKCWATLPMQRPTFKEIILELETMPLPVQWTCQLKELGITRMDTSDMGSSSQETNSISSQVTDPPFETKEPHYRVSEDTRPHTDAPHNSYNQPVKQFSNERFMAAASNTTSQQHHRPSKQTLENTFREKPNFPVPPPCERMSYVRRGPHEMIDRSEIVGDSREKHSFRPGISSVDQLRPHLPYSRLDSNSRPREYVTGMAEQSRRPAYSRFDDKFHDFVSKACEAESASKRQMHQGGGTRAPVAQSKITGPPSDQIRVRSVSTPSESNTEQSVGAAAAYKRFGGDRSVESPLSEFMKGQLQEDYARSSEVLRNARRLLRDSPVKKKPAGEWTGHREASSFSPKPISAPTHDATQEPRFQSLIPRPIELDPSPRSDTVSGESFVPLPPSLNAFHNQAKRPVWTPGTDEGPGGRVPRLLDTASDSSKGTDDVIHVTGGPPLDVAEVLESTAEKLDQVSAVLHSAASDRSRVREDM